MAVTRQDLLRQGWVVREDGHIFKDGWYAVPDSRYPKFPFYYEKVDTKQTQWYDPFVKQQAASVVQKPQVQLGKANTPSNRLSLEEQQLIEQQQVMEIQNPSNGDPTLLSKDNAFLEEQDANDMKELEHHQAFEAKERNVDGKELSEYYSEAAERLRNVEGKMRKDILAAIALYNKADIVKDMLTGRKTFKNSDYKCGTIQCKTRGIKIKNALLQIAAMPASVLGSFEIGEFLKTGLNHLAQSFSSFGTRKRTTSYNKRRTGLTQGRKRSEVYANEALRKPEKHENEPVYAVPVENEGTQVAVPAGASSPAQSKGQPNTYREGASAPLGAAQLINGGKRSLRRNKTRRK
jgi:hypothetical protein